MLKYVNEIIVPFVDRTRDDIHCEKDQTALAIFDCFKGQLSENIITILERNNIHSVIVPANCTDYLQPLDLTVNKVAKSFLKQKFSDWYASQVANQPTEPVDLSTARMKSVGVGWLIELYEQIQNHPEHLVNGFHAAGIPQSIDAGTPVIPQSDDKSDDSDDDSIDDQQTDQDRTDYDSDDDDNDNED